MEVKIKEKGRENGKEVERTERVNVNTLININHSDLAKYREKLMLKEIVFKALLR